MDICFNEILEILAVHHAVHEKGKNGQRNEDKGKIALRCHKQNNDQSDKAYTKCSICHLCPRILKEAEDAGTKLSRT